MQGSFLKNFLMLEIPQRFLRDSLEGEAAAKQVQCSCWGKSKNINDDVDIYT